MPKKLPRLLAFALLLSLAITVSSVLFFKLAPVPTPTAESSQVERAPESMTMAAADENQIDRVRHRLLNLKFSYRDFMRDREKTFPIFLEILNDSDTCSRYVCTIFMILADLKDCDRSQFYEIAWPYLGDDGDAARIDAIILLAQIGKPIDSSAAMSLLVEDGSVAFGAASFLREKGQIQELIAMDLWLRPGDWEIEPRHTIYLRACRDELDERLHCGPPAPARVRPDPPHPDSTLALLGGLGHSPERHLDALQTRLRRLALAALSGDSPGEAACREAIAAVAQFPGDRKEFAIPVLKTLRIPSAELRLEAIRLISQIGGERETSPMHALLLDPDEAVKYAAATCIREIGGNRDAMALGLWLRSGHWHHDKKHKDFVQECRDALGTRLKTKTSPQNPR